MSDLLDLPPIVAPALAEAAAPTSLAELATKPLAQMEPELLALAERYRAVAFDLKTPKGLAAMKAARHDLRENGRFAVQRATAEFKAQANAAKRAVDDLAERLVGIVRPREDEFTAAIDAREAEIEAEKAEARRIEAERVATLTAKVATIRSYVQRAAGASAEKIAAGIKVIESWVFPAEQWQEFAGQAEAARTETLEALRKMHAAALQAEADRAERERLEAQAAERERAEAARREAEEVAERQRQQEAARQEAEAQAREAEETASLVASIRAESRRVEWPKNPAYIRKAMGTFECMAPDWENDPRETVREAIAEGRRYLAGLMAEAEAQARERDRLEKIALAHAAMPPATQNTVTTPGGVVADASTGEVVSVPEPAPAPAIPPAAQEPEAAIKLGDLNATLGFTMTEAFINSLGITPRRDGRAVLVPKSALPRLRDALLEHISKVLA